VATQVSSPIDVYRAWQRSLASGDQSDAARFVDVDRYTEICLGLTDWTTGFDIASAEFYANMLAPWSDLSFDEQDLTESADGVTVRLRVEGTHVGPFLGIPATGRRIAWDHVAIVKVRDGRVVGQWAQPDLWGIHRQLTAAQEEPRAVKAARAYLDAWERHDIDAVRAMVADDILMTMVAADAGFPKMELRGVEQYLAGLLPSKDAVVPGSTMVLQAMGDERHAILSVRSRVKFAPDAPEMEGGSARMYTIGADGRIAAEHVIFFLS
jgi:predicted ester cyclase